MSNNYIRFKHAKFAFKTQLGGNRNGKRILELLVTPEMEDILSQNGLNVKSYSPKDNPDKVIRHLTVEARYDLYPPNVMVVEDGKVKRYKENMLHRLDGKPVDYIEIVINPSFWEWKGQSGVKAYLSELAIFLKPGALEEELRKQYEFIDDDEEESPI